MNPYSLIGYDLFESSRLANKWLGATARAFWGNPVFGLSAHPMPAAFAAWGEVSERAFDRMATKPDWGIDAVVRNGKDYLVNIETVLDQPFGRLIRFKVSDEPDPKRPNILLVAPMSGHYATLLRNTVTSLLPDAEVFITEWKNARDVPVSAGSFDIEDFTKHIIEFLRALGPNVHVMAVCQPAPLAMAATAWLSQHEPENLPRSMTLVGGPVDPDANPSQVTDFGAKTTMGQLEHSVIQTVGANYAGVGRRVYPGNVQLASFIMMNWQTHAAAFANQIAATARKEAHDFDRHNVFYDEYLAVMDMPAEFYLSTVHRIFKKREIATNSFTLDGEHVDLEKITDLPVKVIEGGRDDISAPGQCAAALRLLCGVPEEKKAYHLEPDAGHYGIFSGRAWHQNIRPVFLNFVRQHSRK